MSFGFGASDFINVPVLAWSVYKACRDSSEEFQRIAKEVSLLHIALKETQDFMGEYKMLSPSREERLKTLYEGAYEVLKDLDGHLEKYESLGTAAQRTWDRLKWGLQDVSAIRDRLISITTTLSAFNISLANSSHIRIEKKLNKLIDEVNRGLHEGSTISVQTVESIGTREAWQQLRRELENVGISASVIAENQEFITAWFREAVQKGQLTDSDSADLASLAVPASTLMSETTTLVDVSELERNLSESALHLTVPAPRLSYKTKKSRMSSLVFKLFRSDALLLEAASDGDATRTAKLLGVGANVNVTDRWGWTPMSMAAYGGHAGVAQVLLDYGARLDMKDVDGDTPLTLATNRGHTPVVCMIEEELQRRMIKDD